MSPPTPSSPTQGKTEELGESLSPAVTSPGPHRGTSAPRPLPHAPRRAAIARLPAPWPSPYIARGRTFQRPRASG